MRSPDTTLTANVCRARIALQIFTGFAVLAAILSAYLVQLRVDYSSFIFIYYMSGTLYCGALLCIWRKDRYLAPMFESVAAGFLLTLVALITTYSAMALRYPLADAQLAAMDLALQFDWFAFIEFVDSSPLLSKLLANSYQSFSFQLLGIPIVLCILRQPIRACQFVMAYGIVCLISSIVTIWYPALGTFVVYGVAAQDLANINAHFGFFFLQDFHAVRDDPSFILSMGTASGIVTFPSVHAAVGCLAAWAMWQNRFARYPFLLLNLGMCISAVSHANHYVVDVIAGAGIAGLSISLAGILLLSPGQAQAYLRRSPATA